MAFWRFFEIGGEAVVGMIAVLACGLCVVAYLIEKFRPKSAQKELTSHDLLTKFRDLHSGGELSDEEFRTIKTALASELQEELKGKGEML